MMENLHWHFIQENTHLGFMVAVIVCFSLNKIAACHLNGLGFLMALTGVEFGIRHADKPTQDRRENTSIIDVLTIISIIIRIILSTSMTYI